MLSTPRELTLKHYKGPEHIVNHSLVLLEGEVSKPLLPEAEKTEDIKNEHKNEVVPQRQDNVHEMKVLVSHDGSCQQWPIIDGNFKAFVKLNKGVNNVEVLCPALKSCQTLTLVRTKPENQPRFVRVVYIKCSDSDGKFDSPEDTKNDVDMAVKKLQFNALLLQSFTAVDMYKHGFGFQTFQLEEDENGEVVVHVFDSKLTTEKAHSMTGSQLYSWFHKELHHSSLYDPNVKFLTFMSCTHYDPPEDMDIKHITKYVKAHTALGGGNFGLFGTGGLHTWASGLDDLVKCFTDEREIDKKKLFDDSARRGTFWANYSTTLGAAVHELGHCFDLAHTPNGIMGRGFDDMNCFAIVASTKKKNSDNKVASDGGTEPTQHTVEVVSDGTDVTIGTPSDGTQHATWVVNDGTQVTTEETSDDTQHTTQVVNVGTKVTIKAPGHGTQHATEVVNDGVQVTTEETSDDTQHTTQVVNFGTKVTIEEPGDGTQHTQDVVNKGIQVTKKASSDGTDIAKPVMPVTKLVRPSGEFTTEIQKDTMDTTKICSVRTGLTPLTPNKLLEATSDGTIIAIGAPSSGTKEVVSCAMVHPTEESNVGTNLTTTTCDNANNNKSTSTVSTILSDHDGIDLSTEIFTDHRAHWYRSSAVILHYHKWFTTNSCPSEDDQLVLQVNWSSDVKGPVGNGGGGQKNQTFFDDNDWCTTYGLVIAGYAVYHSKYINALEPLTTSLPKTKLKADPIRGKVNKKCTISIFLLEEGEYLTSVEVRSGAWIDGIRFHTNLKSSEWYGGQGGNWNRLRPGNEGRITGFFGTFGNFLGSLGIHVGQSSLDQVPKNPQIESSLGIRLIELRTDEEVVKFWEFLDENPPRIFIVSSEWLMTRPHFEQCTLFLVDDHGNVCESGFLGFQRFFGETQSQSHVSLT